MRGTRRGHLLAEDELSWSRDERQTDRYGAITIQTGGFFARTQEDSAAGLPAEYARFEDAPIGKIGRLLVEVTVTHESHHIGDVDREIKPSTPEVGEYDDVTSIGVKPQDGRETGWMDVPSLYRAHAQDVKLYFVPDQP